MSSQSQPHGKAVLMLVFTTLLWGLSFPLYKAMALKQQLLLPSLSSWGVASLSLWVRFGGGTLFMVLYARRKLRGLTLPEFWQGLGLGIFAASGLLAQMDGLSYTSASTSAFLTQMYCLLIPLWVALRHRERPSALLLVSCALVLWGVACLSKLSLSDFRLGRGEIETLVASVLFAGQILWLERPAFGANSTVRATLVMFATVALLMTPVAWATGGLAGFAAVYRSPFVIGAIVVLIVLCTITSYLIMNQWQPLVTASEAGIIYCFEPIFASVLALYAPAWLSSLAGLRYLNENVTRELLWGGGLITAANILLQTKAFGLG